jgi:Flp pilus assembly protein TadG
MKQRNRSRSRASTLRGPRGRVRRGTAAVEAVFVLIMMIPLLLGALEGSRIAEVQQILSNAAREGARQAASGQLTVAQTKQVVTYYLQDAGLPTSNAIVTVQDTTDPTADPTIAAEFDNLQVTVTIPFKDVRWSGALLVTSNSTNLTAAANWFSANGSAYPTSITVPPGY